MMSEALDVALKRDLRHALRRNFPSAMSEDLERLDAVGRIAVHGEVPQEGGDDLRVDRHDAALDPPLAGTSRPR